MRAPERSSKLFNGDCREAPPANSRGGGEEVRVPMRSIRARGTGLFVVFSDGRAVGRLARRRFERSVGPAGSGSAAHRFPGIARAPTRGVLGRVVGVGSPACERPGPGRALFKAV